MAQFTRREFLPLIPFSLLASAGIACNLTPTSPEPTALQEELLDPSEILAKYHILQFNFSPLAPKVQADTLDQGLSLFFPSNFPTGHHLYVEFDGVEMTPYYVSYMLAAVDVDPQLPSSQQHVLTRSIPKVMSIENENVNPSHVLGLEATKDLLTVMSLYQPDQPLLERPAFDSTFPDIQEFLSQYGSIFKFPPLGTSA